MKTQKPDKTHRKESTRIGEAATAAEEATGHIPIGKLREEILPEEAQAADDHEPYGAHAMPVKEKGRKP